MEQAFNTIENILFSSNYTGYSQENEKAKALADQLRMSSKWLERELEQETNQYKKFDIEADIKYAKREIDHLEKQINKVENKNE